jgi:hypothetical protein
MRLVSEDGLWPHEHAIYAILGLRLQPRSTGSRHFPVLGPARRWVASPFNDLKGGTEGWQPGLTLGAALVA